MNSTLTATRKPLMYFALSLGAGAVFAAELARVGAVSSAKAADTGLSMLLGALLPLATALTLLSFQPIPRGLTISLGQSRRGLLLRRYAALAAGSCAVTLGVTVGILIWTRTPRDPQLLADLSVTLPIAVGTQLATLSVFGAARSWAGRLGLLGALILSWTLGQSDVVASALLPAGHTRHLIGVGEPLPISTSLSAGCLVAFALLFLGALLLRAPR